MPRTPPRRFRRIRLLHALMGALLAVVMADVGVAASRAAGTPTDSTDLSCSAPPGHASVMARETSIGRAAREVLPAVVSITARSNGRVMQGSGIVIRSDGLVLTNNHVVADVGVNGGAVEVTAAGNRSVRADIVGRMPKDDIAVVQAVGLHDLDVAAFASSATLQVGDVVIAVGNPLGQAGSVTAGIVSALRRPACVTTPQVPTSTDKLFGSTPYLPKKVRLHGLIQTDAPINPGNSGGALADTAGRVVGITTLNLTENTTGASSGIGFAIPIEIAYRDAQQILKSAAS